jgi:hypothetical protein
MNANVTWWDIGDGYGVLELNEAVTRPRAALELHVLTTDGETRAFWLDDEGRWLGLAEVGDA